MLGFCLSMLVSFQKNNTPFTSQPLYNVNLIKLKDGKEIGFADAILSKLSPTDIEDCKAIEIIKDIWGQKSALAKQFCESFLAKPPETDEFYVLERKGEIIGLSQTSFLDFVSQKFLRGSRLVVHPDFRKESNSKRELKGIGEILYGNAFKRAKELEVTDFDFYSANDSYHKKTFENAQVQCRIEGHPEKQNKHFLVSPDYFQNYLDYCKRIYKTDFSKKIQS